METEDFRNAKEKLSSITILVEDMMEDLLVDLSKSLSNNAAAKRLRTGSVKLCKTMKQLRKLSVEYGKLKPKRKINGN